MHCVRVGISLIGFTWLALSVGCGSGAGNSVAEAGGTVTLDGKPVPNLVVTLTPSGIGEGNLPGKSATGITDEEGRFTLSTYEIGDGAIVGEHRVGISLDGPDPKPPGKLPPDYKLQVEPGSNDFSIELVKQ